MGSSNSYKGSGKVAGAGEYQSKSSNKMGMASMKEDMYPSAKPGKGPSKVPNHTRGREEVGT